MPNRPSCSVPSAACALLLLVGCTAETATPTEQPATAPAIASNTAPSQPAQPAPAAQDPVAAMDTAIAQLMQQAELADSAITVQHILVAFQGAPRITGVTRSKDEAKALAAQIYAQVKAGGDFDALMKANSNDAGPGVYPMTKAGRAQMVKGFGDVGFRLAVGEIGVAPWDAAASPFGWHIIKRVK